MIDNNDHNNFRQALLEEENWPLLYMFKFIVPNHGGKVERVKGLMPEHGELSFKHTKSLKFVSVTCKAYMPDADSIILVTQKAIEVKGVIAL